MVMAGACTVMIVLLPGLAGAGPALVPARRWRHPGPLGAWPEVRAAVCAAARSPVRIGLGRDALRMAADR